jgi:hypothetical protein
MSTASPVLRRRASRAARTLRLLSACQGRSARDGSATVAACHRSLSPRILQFYDADTLLRTEQRKTTGEVRNKRA